MEHYGVPAADTPRFMRVVGPTSRVERVRAKILKVKVAQNGYLERSAIE